MSTRPFRFGAKATKAKSAKEWTDLARQAEDLGYASFQMDDHMGNQLAIVGLTFLAVAMTGAILLVTDVLFGGTTSVISAGVLALAFAVLWYAIPLQRLRHRRRSD